MARAPKNYDVYHDGIRYQAGSELPSGVSSATVSVAVPIFRDELATKAQQEAWDREYEYANRHVGPGEEENWVYRQVKVDVGYDPRSGRRLMSDEEIEDEIQADYAELVEMYSHGTP